MIFHVSHFFTYFQEQYDGIPMVNKLPVLLQAAQNSNASMEVCHNAKLIVKHSTGIMSVL